MVVKNLYLETYGAAQAEEITGKYLLLTVLTISQGMHLVLLCLLFIDFNCITSAQLLLDCLVLLVCLLGTDWRNDEP